MLTLRDKARWLTKAHSLLPIPLRAPNGAVSIALKRALVTDLASQTARSSVRLIKQALADMRGASADHSDVNIQEVTRSVDMLSSAIKRLAAYVADTPKEDETPRKRGSKDITRVNRILEPANEVSVCPKCGHLRP